MTGVAAILLSPIGKPITRRAFIASGLKFADRGFSNFVATETANTGKSDQQPSKRSQEHFLIPPQQSWDSLSSFTAPFCSWHNMSHGADHAWVMLEATPTTHKKKLNANITVYALRAKMNILLTQKASDRVDEPMPLACWLLISQNHFKNKHERYQINRVSNSIRNIILLSKNCRNTDITNQTFPWPGKHGLPKAAIALQTILS
jgi:hypothetical protein